MIPRVIFTVIEIVITAIASSRDIFDLNKGTEEEFCSARTWMNANVKFWMKRNKQDA